MARLPKHQVALTHSPQGERARGQNMASPGSLGLRCPKKIVPRDKWWAIKTFFCCRSCPVRDGDPENPLEITDATAGQAGLPAEFKHIISGGKET